MAKKKDKEIEEAQELISNVNFYKVEYKLLPGQTASDIQIEMFSALRFQIEGEICYFYSEDESTHYEDELVGVCINWTSIKKVPKLDINPIPIKLDNINTASFEDFKKKMKEAIQKIADEEKAD